MSVYNLTFQGIPGDNDVLNSAAGRFVDSDSEDGESGGYGSDGSSFVSSESGLLVHYTDSIMNLVGLICEGWVDSS